jgi:hypothetical protein
MSRRLSFGLLALTTGLAACGGTTDNNQKSDGGTIVDTPDPAYWGLADKNCFRYDDGSGDNYFTLSVTEDPNTVAGVKTYRLAFRDRGWLKREEWLEVRGDGLMLWRRSDPGDQFASPPVPPTFSIFAVPGATDAPPPVYIPKELRLQVPTISKLTATVSSGTTSEKVATTVTVTKDADEPVQALEAEQASSKLILGVTRDEDGSGTTDILWFVPNVGIAQYELSDTNTKVTLVKAEQNVKAADCTP